MGWCRRSVHRMANGGFLARMVPIADLIPAGFSRAFRRLFETPGSTLPICAQAKDRQGRFNMRSPGFHKATVRGVNLGFPGKPAIRFPYEIHTFSISREIADSPVFTNDSHKNAQIRQKIPFAPETGFCRVRQTAPESAVLPTRVRDQTVYDVRFWVPTGFRPIAHF